MHVVDTLLLLLVAFGDVALMVHLRRARGRRLRDERMCKALRVAIQRDARAQATAPRAKVWELRRAG